MDRNDAEASGDSRYKKKHKNKYQRHYYWLNTQQAARRNVMLIIHIEKCPQQHKNFFHSHVSKYGDFGLD